MNSDATIIYELFRLSLPFVIIFIGLWSKEQRAVSFPVKGNDDFKFRKFCLVFGAFIYLPIELVRVFTT